jgi:uncharacterized protein YciI
MKEIYALLYHQTGSSEEFMERIPRLMAWLRELHRTGNLVACGGGGWSDDTGGGLTLITADTPEQAEAIAAGTPMNEIGHTDIMLWDCFYGDLSHFENRAKLESAS